MESFVDCFVGEGRAPHQWHQFGPRCGHRLDRYLCLSPCRKIRLTLSACVLPPAYALHSSYLQRPSAHHAIALHSSHSNDLQVTATKTVKSTGKGGTTTSYSYKGIFVTRAGALFVVPPNLLRKNAVIVDIRDTEKKMLRVLFSTGLNPRANPSVVRECDTPEGIRSAFSKMVRAAGDYPTVGSTQTVSSLASERRFDCLLLVRSAARGVRSESPGGRTIPRTVGRRVNVALKYNKAGWKGALSHVTFFPVPTPLASHLESD